MEVDLLLFYSLVSTSSLDNKYKYEMNTKQSNYLNALESFDVEAKNLETFLELYFSIIALHATIVCLSVCYVNLFKFIVHYLNQLSSPLDQG